MNEANLRLLIANLTGISFLFDYWWNSGISVIAIFVLLIWAGVFLSSSMLDQKQSGFGCMIAARRGYRSYLLNTFFAQSVYILLIVAAATLLQAAFAFTFGGFGAVNINLGPYDLSAVQAAGVVALQIVIVALYIILANGLALMLSAFVKSRYLVQALPLFLCGLLPLLLVSVLSGGIVKAYQIPRHFDNCDLSRVGDSFVCNQLQRKAGADCLFRQYTRGYERARAKSVDRKELRRSFSV